MSINRQSPASIGPEIGKSSLTWGLRPEARTGRVEGQLLMSSVQVQGPVSFRTVQVLGTTHRRREKECEARGNGPQCGNGEKERPLAAAPRSPSRNPPTCAKAVATVPAELSLPPGLSLHAPPPGNHPLGDARRENSKGGEIAVGRSRTLMASA